MEPDGEAIGDHDAGEGGAPPGLHRPFEPSLELHRLDPGAEQPCRGTLDEPLDEPLDGGEWTHAEPRV